jgi:hypothetical protein
MDWPASDASVYAMIPFRKLRRSGLVGIAACGLLWACSMGLEYRTFPSNARFAGCLGCRPNKNQTLESAAQFQK